MLDQGMKAHRALAMMSVMEKRYALVLVAANGTVRPIWITAIHHCFVIVSTGLTRMLGVASVPREVRHGEASWYTKSTCPHASPCWSVVDLAGLKHAVETCQNSQYHDGRGDGEEGERPNTRGLDSPRPPL